MMFALPSLQPVVFAFFKCFVLNGYKIRPIPLANRFLGSPQYCQSVTNSADVGNAVHSTLIHECNVMENDAILLCVSGGSDSMSMFHILANIRNRWNPSLHLEVVNFNHKLREVSDEEEIFIKNWCGIYNIKFHSRQLPIEKRSKIGLQEIAREWRREECLLIRQQYLHELQHKFAISNQSNFYIATAHQQDDQLETFMLKFLRGTHISRLFPMLPRNGPFIKPLLSIKKSDLVDYLISNGYEWREDVSNAQRDYKRNRLRLDIIPLLQQESGSERALHSRMNDISEQSYDLRSWLESERIKYLSTHTMQSPYLSPYRYLRTGTDFAALPPLVQSEILYMFVFTTTGLKLSYLLVKKLIALITSHNSSSGPISDTGNTTTVGSTGNTARVLDGGGYVSLSLSSYWELLCDATVAAIRPRPELSSTSSSSIEGYTTTTTSNNLGKMINISVNFPKELQVIIEVSDPMTDLDPNPTDTDSMANNNNNDDNKADNILQYMTFYNVPIAKSLNFTVRFRKDGDRFHPSWSQKSTKLTHFLRGQGLSPVQREILPIVVLHNGGGGGGGGGGVGSDGEVVAIPCKGLVSYDYQQSRKDVALDTKAHGVITIKMIMKLKESLNSIDWNAEALMHDDDLKYSEVEDDNNEEI